MQAKHRWTRSPIQHPCNESECRGIKSEGQSITARSPWSAPTTTGHCHRYRPQQYEDIVTDIGPNNTRTLSLISAPTIQGHCHWYWPQQYKDIVADIDPNNTRTLSLISAPTIQGHCHWYRPQQQEDIVTDIDPNNTRTLSLISAPTTRGHCHWYRPQQQEDIVTDIGPNNTMSVRARFDRQVHCRCLHSQRARRLPFAPTGGGQGHRSMPPQKGQGHSYLFPQQDDFFSFLSSCSCMPTVFTSRSSLMRSNLTQKQRNSNTVTRCRIKVNVKHSKLVQTRGECQTQ